MTQPQQPLVSIVVPTRNRRVKLQRCLESLAAQTIDAIEVFVVDDGSIDETPAFVQEFAARHPNLRLRCLRNDRPLGPNRSRNRAIRESGARYIAFIDDDCIARPDWLQRLLPRFDGESVAAVTGLVEDTPPTNLFELMFKGTHRVYAPDGVRATRLVAGNLAVRRELLLSHVLDADLTTVSDDMSVSSPCDEEGIFIHLRRAGYELRVAPDAVVVHDHPHTGRSVMHLAVRGGRAAARLVHKYGLPPRIDLVPFIAGYLSLALLWVHPWLAAVPLLCFGAGLAALAYNELFRKAKTPLETIKTFPILLVYYQLRLAGYVYQSARLWLGLDTIEKSTFRHFHKSTSESGEATS